MRYYIIAGEASGDLHASNLIRHLKEHDNGAVFRAWGGDLMEQQGARIVTHYRDIAYMGFLEVALHLRTILSNLQHCKSDILNFQTDVIILVDYPGFNLRIAQWAHEQGLKVVYYISPQVWAWKKNRVYSIKKNVDKMIVILPFEQKFYAGYDYKVDYVGHPLLDAVAQNGEKSISFLSENQLTGKPIIALLPGSRKQEIRKMLGIMLKVTPYFSDYQFVIAGAPSIESSFYKEITGSKKVNIVTGQTQQLLKHAHAALVTSGTATLETALLNVPEVVCYKGSRISYEIAKRIVDIKYISLVNLIMDREIVKELIQDKLTIKNLKTELEKILDGSSRQKMLDDFALLKSELGSGGASAKAAEIIFNFIK